MVHKTVLPFWHQDLIVDLIVVITWYSSCTTDVICLKMAVSSKCQVIFRKSERAQRETAVIKFTVPTEQFFLSVANKYQMVVGI